MLVTTTPVSLHAGMSIASYPVPFRAMILSFGAERMSSADMGPTRITPSQQKRWRRGRTRSISLADTFLARPIDAGTQDALEELIRQRLGAGMEWGGDVQRRLGRGYVDGLGRALAVLFLGHWSSRLKCVGGVSMVKIVVLWWARVSSRNPARAAVGCSRSSQQSHIPLSVAPLAATSDAFVLVSGQCSMYSSIRLQFYVYASRLALRNLGATTLARLVLAELGEPLLDEEDLELVHVADAGRLEVVVLESVLPLVRPPAMAALYGWPFCPASPAGSSARTHLVPVVDAALDKVQRLIDGGLALRCDVGLGRLMSAYRFLHALPVEHTSTHHGAPGVELAINVRQPMRLEPVVATRIHVRHIRPVRHSKVLAGEVRLPADLGRVIERHKLGQDRRALSRRGHEVSPLRAHCCQLAQTS